MAKQEKLFALRCASASRIDFFEASIVTTAEGSVEIRGGNVRDPYLPHEVYIVSAKQAGDVRPVVSEVERALAESVAHPSRPSDHGDLAADVMRTRGRDDIECLLPRRMLDLVVRRFGLVMADQHLRLSERRSPSVEEVRAQ